ncbi:MAG TPA: SCP2 sterol-binding domain-containing protein [Acidimicrobiales bacterium]|jgi:hypothetical protein|nr:SCP2 sterol-binding domain-containing protein [Acidimicrobiales bacterium]
MPRYLSLEWVEAFNTALAGLDLRPAIAATADTSLTAGLGSFAVAQVVPDGPDGPIRTVLSVADGQVSLAADPDDTLPSNVTIVLSYADALAIARAELEPADALAAGRVRVRGELAVLVAGQAVLNAAGAALGPALHDLTDLS